MFKCKMCGIRINWDDDRSYDYCAEHLEEGRRREHERAVQNHKEWFESYGETNADQQTVCPYCFYIDNELECLPGYLHHDGDEADIFCPMCEKKYHVSLAVTYTFTARRIKER